MLSSPLLKITDIGNGSRRITVVLSERHVVCLSLFVRLWVSLDNHQHSRRCRHGRVVLHHGEQHALQHVSSRTTCLLCPCRSCSCGPPVLSVCVEMSRKAQRLSSDKWTERHFRTHARPFVDQQRDGKAWKKGKRQ